MRKLVLTTVLGIVAAAGLAACANNPSDPSGGSTTAAAGADTKSVCAEALSEGTAASAEFKAKMNEGVQAIMAGDQAKANQLEAQMHERLATWATKVKDLAAKDVSAQVKSALTEISDTITKLNDPGDQTSVDQVEAKFTELGTKLAAACA